jgi:hypothetical protein
VTRQLQCGHVDDVLRDRGPEHPLWYDRKGRTICTRCYERLAGDWTYKRIAEDIIGLGSPTQARVSTVWIGIDYSWLGNGPPVIFETMIFAEGNVLDGEMGRYVTEDQARAGHAEWVTLLRTALDVARIEVETLEAAFAESEGDAP